MNTAVAVHVCSANHALITQPERLRGLGTRERDRDETRLDLNSVVGPFVQFNVLGEKTFSVHAEANNVRVVIDSCAHDVTVQRIEVFIVATLKPSGHVALVNILSTEKSVVGDAVHSFAVRAATSRAIAGIHDAKLSIGPHPATVWRHIAEEPVGAANDQSFVHAHCNRVNIRVRTALRCVEVGNDILVRP